MSSRWVLAVVMDAEDEGHCCCEGIGCVLLPHPHSRHLSLGSWRRPRCVGQRKPAVTWPPALRQDRRRPPRASPLWPAAIEVERLSCRTQTISPPERISNTASALDALTASPAAETKRRVKRIGRARCESLLPATEGARKLPWGAQDLPKTAHDVGFRAALGRGWRYECGASRAGASCCSGLADSGFSPPPGTSPRPIVPHWTQVPEQQIVEPRLRASRPSCPAVTPRGRKGALSESPAASTTGASRRRGGPARRGTT